MTGVFGHLSSYGNDVQTRMSNALYEGRLAAQEPYSNGYVADARSYLDRKKTELDLEKSIWSDYAKKVEGFYEFVDNQDGAAADEFKKLSDNYVDYKGLKGVAQYLRDTAYNLFVVDFANKNDFSRAISGWIKEKADDMSIAWQRTKDYFSYGDGRYILNIGIQVAKISVAVIGVATTLLAAPWTGGTSLYATVALVGFAASCIAAVCTSIDGVVSISENVKVLKDENRKENPGRARYFGDTSGISS
jgi:hypothetical protein